MLDANVRQYMHEWEVTGWSDWQAAYDNEQTRLYNFYSQPALRVAFCAAARDELAAVGAVADAALPDHARAALVRLDAPFIEFFTAFDAWRDHYQPRVEPPPVVATLPEGVPYLALPPFAAPVVPPPVVETVSATATASR